MPAAVLPNPASSSGCRLVAVDGTTLPLREVSVAADAGGGLATVVLSQRFANPHDEPLRVTYQLPLPADAAVVDYAFVLDGRRVQGRIDRRADARAAFEQAIVEGRSAALLEEDRSSLFRQELGNLPAGAEVVVEVTVEQLLAWRDGGWQWRWPTVVAPRYLGERTADADRVTVDIADQPVPVRCRCTLTVADAEHGVPTSSSHPLALDDGRVRLAGALDRDLVVRWTVAEQRPGVRVESARPVGDEAAYALVTVVPPEQVLEPVARDLILLLDTSGSMGGAPLRQLQRFASALVEGLGAADRLEMIEFGTRPSRWRAEPVPVTDRSRADALGWLAALRARGGTRMHDGIYAALAPLRPEAQRQVVLVTDGLIGFEAEIVRRIRQAMPAGCRVHTVGIGAAVNRTLTSSAARAGAGSETVVGPDEDPGAAVASLLARTGTPALVDLTVSGARQVAPVRLPDLLAGQPVRLLLALDPAGGTVQLAGRTGSGSWEHSLAVGPVASGSGRRVVATRFARERVADLEVDAAVGEHVDAAIEALGLQHRIATRLTSWVAVGEQVTVDPGEAARAVTVPQGLPYGMSAEGIGLRSPRTPGRHSVARVIRGLETTSLVDTLVEVGSADVSRVGAAQALPPAPARKRRPRGDGPALGGYGRGSRPEPAEPGGQVRVTARVRLHRFGLLVLEIVAPADLVWSPERLTDETGAALATRAGTTNSGPVRAGRTIRIVLRAETAPSRLVAGSLHIEVVS